MQRIAMTVVGVALVIGACSDASIGADATVLPADPTPQPPATSTTEPTTTTSTKALPATTQTTTVTTETSLGFACPDLYDVEGDDAERQDGVLAAWVTPDGEPMWEIPLGSRVPAWAVWSDTVILGFTDGELTGIDVATCDSWSITIPGGIDDLAVTEQGLILALNRGNISAYSGQGFGAWIHQAIDSWFRFAGENNGIHVFVDQFGDITGFDTGGEVTFIWGGASEAPAVAVSESFVYRATGAEIAARPAGGGEVIWANEISGIEALYVVPGLLLAVDGESLHALAPATGELIWSIPFADDIARPMVLDHGELHILARDDSVGFDTLWHLDTGDGATIFRGIPPAGGEWFSEMDDGLVLEVGEDGTVTAVNLLHNDAWTVQTGANRIDRVTEAEVARGAVIVTLTYSAERF
jgi:outer membrane protein assembly factor BamB